MAVSSFLQSPEWEGFQRSIGRHTWRVNGTLVIRHDLRFGLHYMYCPRPSIGLWDEGFGMRALDTVADLAKNEKGVFLKIDPLHPLYPIPYTSYLSRSLQPRQTVVLDLFLPEEALLVAMREKTRYNIRLAERKGVAVRNFQFSSPIRSGINFQNFFELLRATAARDGFRAHPREYYERLLGIRSDLFSNELFFAEYRGIVLAAALVNFYRSPTSIGGTATYLHGASSREYKEAMASYLLHWRIIQEIKRRGIRSYDFWGIDEERWPGLTRFKKGFGGAELTYPSSIDVVYRPVWYTAYRIWRRFRRR